ncbi:nicotinamidase [Geomonas paludis]|uniref:nicotinamidase n=1 Tax=Geomonas paludis TaxID=2740185 RepID=A0A6V8MVT9_9BACT|nr:nicotinamidase [Geomonas paludis]UPU34185.1 nicotinamidase [Geomonas paludis]GFO64161.1 nicotinamidase [Geomonas paludis]
MQRRAALLVIDVQLDFCPGGALPVSNGDQVVPVLNLYLELFNMRSVPVFASRDWHPEHSKHFKEQGGIWPPHCVQGSPGADFHPGLRLPKGTIVISKGMSSWDNGYSAMQGTTENGTPFAMLLRRMELDRLYVGGLATDYCVKETVLEALKEGFAVTVLTDAVRGVDVKPGDTERALQEMRRAGADQTTFSSVRSALLADGEARPPARTG